MKAVLLHLNRQGLVPDDTLTVNVRAKVNFADIVVLKHRGVACVGSVVCSAVVEGAACGERQASIQTILFDQLPGAVLQFLTAGKKMPE